MVRIEVAHFDPEAHAPGEVELSNNEGVTFLLEGIPAACAGVFDGPRGPEAWVIVRCAFTRHLRVFLRFLRETYMPAVARSRGDLWAHVPLGDPKIERWLRFWGFQFFCRCDYYDLYRRQV